MTDSTPDSSPDSMTQWAEATGNLKWGVQRAFKTVLEAVKNEQVTLVYGADYSNGSPCLVNAVGSMLTTGGGQGVPSTHFGPVVSLFDRINRELQYKGINKNGTVSPLAAEILLQHFGELKPVPEKDVVDATAEVIAAQLGVYREKSDEELAKEWAEAFVSSHTPCEEELSSELMEEIEADLNELLKQ